MPRKRKGRNRAKAAIKDLANNPAISNKMAGDVRGSEVKKSVIAAVGVRLSGNAPNANESVANDASDIHATHDACLQSYQAAVRRSWVLMRESALMMEAASWLPLSVLAVAW